MTPSFPRPMTASVVWHATQEHRRRVRGEPARNQRMEVDPCANSGYSAGPPVPASDPGVQWRGTLRVANPGETRWPSAQES